MIRYLNLNQLKRAKSLHGFHGGMRMRLGEQREVRKKGQKVSMRKWEGIFLKNVKNQEDGLTTLIFRFGR
jgi:hypothetical protein